METYQKLKKLYLLSDTRKWGNIGPRTEFFFNSDLTGLQICRFGVMKYRDVYHKIVMSSGEEIYKIKYFQQIFKSAEEVNETKSSLIQEITINYLDLLLLDVIRNECKDLHGTKLIFHSCGKPDEVEEMSMPKRIYVV